jgi:hypothetical protein
MNLTGSSNCTAADFDTTLQFQNGPGDSFTIVVSNLNLASAACVFDGPMYGPSIVPDRVEGDKPFGLCYFCDERLPNGQVPMHSPITVPHGEIARQTFRWKTAPPNDSVRCLQPKWIAGPVLLVTPSLLPKICSDVEVSRFTLAPPEETAPSAGGFGQTILPQAFQLTAERTRYNAGESFSLELSPIPATPAITPRADSCPTFYLRQRSPEGSTRIDEVQPMTSKGCKTFIPGRRPINHESSFELDSGANSRWEGFGEHQFQVLQLLDSANYAELRLVSSNILSVDIADPAAISRKWGTKVKGIATDVTLEKDTYRVGEDIPLHIAVEDFDAPVEISTWDPLWDPCMTVGVQVQDAQGHLLPANERLPDQTLCMGHGFGPRPIAKGKLIPIERTLAGEGWLPKNPGTYTIVVTWCPSTPIKPRSKAAGSWAFKTYATVQATATIHIVVSETSASN